MSIPKSAVRAFHRLLSVAIAKLDEQERYDAYFDGGEWSGAFFDRYRAEVTDQLLAQVAARFCVSADELLTAVIVADHYAEKHFCFTHRVN